MTGYALKEVAVSPSGHDQWTILFDRDVDDNTTVRLSFDDRIAVCTWDLRIVFGRRRTTGLLNDIDVCQNDKMTLSYNRETDRIDVNFQPN